MLPELSEASRGPYAPGVEGAGRRRLIPLLGSPYTLTPLEEGQWGCSQTALETNDHIQPDLWPLWWPLGGLAALAHQPFGAVPLSPLHTLLHLPGLCSARPQLGLHQAQGRSSGIWGPGGAWKQQVGPAPTSRRILHHLRQVGALSKEGVVVVLIRKKDQQKVKILWEA